MIADRERFDQESAAHAVVAKGTTEPASLPPTVSDTLQRLTRDAARFLGCPRVALMVLDAASGDLHLAAAHGFERGAHPARLALQRGIPGSVAVRRATEQVDDLARDERRHAYPDGQRTGSALGVPLVDDDILFGALAAYHDQVRAFSARHSDLLGIFGEHATAILARARHQSATSVHQRQLALFVTAARAMTALLAPREIFANIAAGIQQIIHYDDALVFVADPAGEELRMVAGLGAEGERLIDQRVRVADTTSLSATVARNRRSVAHAPDTHSLVAGRVTEAFLAGRERALLCVPLISKETLRGVVTLSRQAPFAPEELRAMDELAPLVATAIENATLYTTVKSERERLRAIFAATADGIVLVDSQARVVEVNAAFARMCGRPLAALRGAPLLASCAPLGAPPDATRTDLGAVAHALREALQGRAVAGALECALPGVVAGEPRQALLSVAAVAAPEGPQAVVIAHDVTDLRKLDGLRTQLLHMLSHEIRAPLLPLNGYLDVALRGMVGPLSDAQSDIIRRAQAVARQLTARTQDLATLLANEEASDIALDGELEPVELDRIITSVVEEVELLATERGIALHVSLAPQLPRIAGNSGRLGQVVRNLLNNALKFTPRGGHVWVEASASAETLDMSVADTGCGVASEHVPYIFERFYQAPARQGSRAGVGQGLGLAIVKMIVARHGGWIQVHSQVGQGSRFIVHFPVRPQSGVPATPLIAPTWVPPV